MPGTPPYPLAPFIAQVLASTIPWQQVAFPAFAQALQPTTYRLASPDAASQWAFVVQPDSRGYAGPRLAYVYKPLPMLFLAREASALLAYLPPDMHYLQAKLTYEQYILQAPCPLPGLAHWPTGERLSLEDLYHAALEAEEDEGLY